MRGCIFGVALVGPRDLAQLVGVDVDGALWSFAEDSRPRLVRLCLERGWLVCPDLATLCYSLRVGLCFGVTPHHLARVPARQFHLLGSVELA